MTINERVRYLRKDLKKMTLAQFGGGVGFGSSAIANVENGTNNVSTQLFTAIVQRYGVSPEWLRDGVGDPFLPKPRDQQIMDFVSEVMNKPPDAIERKILALMAKIRSDEWDRIAEIAERFMDDEQ